MRHGEPEKAKVLCQLHMVFDWYHRLDRYSIWEILFLHLMKSSSRFRYLYWNLINSDSFWLGAYLKVVFSIEDFLIFRTQSNLKSLVKKGTVSSTIPHPFVVTSSFTSSFFFLQLIVKITYSLFLIFSFLIDVKFRS